MELKGIQNEIRARGFDGWLFFDHHGRDPLASRILGLPVDLEASRRWYYLIPATGDPRKLVHRIESRTLDTLPGDKKCYSSWTDQHRRLEELLKGCSRVAMQYSPKCAIPYVSNVDAGTLELIRGFGKEIVSSADLVQIFEARWTAEQVEMHLEAGRRVDQVRRDAFNLVGERIRNGQEIGEYEVQQFILARFSQSNLSTNHGPIVAVNQHASDPHYEPSPATSLPIEKGNMVLIDLWAKLIFPGAVYYDVTWVGYCGSSIPAPVEKVFEIVRDARKSASQFVIDKMAWRQTFAGYEVDDVARAFIEKEGFGEFFFHRTGHSIGTEVHGTGANMDNLESHDDRAVIADTCFSIEPGIYLPEFGIRSEVNVYVGKEKAFVTGEEQEQLICI
ncbi:MAG: peptidase [Bryobacterales bacterium]|nr:peptidase [Bryobacterales bacterium]